MNYPAAELRGIKNQKEDVPDSDTSFIEFTLLPLITKQESLLQYFLAFGEAVFIPTAELWGIQQHFL